MSKVFVFYYLIHVLMWISLIGESSALLDILCLRPPFATITPFTANKSYFVSDDSGRYWNFIKEDTHYDNYQIMRSYKNGYIKDMQTKSAGSIKMQMNDGDVPYFDITFRTNFDSRGSVEAEKLFGFRLLKNKSTVFTYYSKNEWSDIKLFNPQQIIFGHDMLKVIKETLSTTKVIKAVLDFKAHGFLFIQDTKMFYVYCEGNGWKLYDNEVKTNLIVFDKNYEINLGQIFGGYVDDMKRQLFLFSGQISSVGSFVRKFVHKCDYKIEKSGKPAKIRLFCEKLFYKTVCDKSEKELDFETKIVIYALIAASSILLIMVIVLAVMVCLKPRQKKIVPSPTTTETSSGSTSRKSPKRLLAQNRDRVLGDKPKPDAPKGGLSRNRTQNFTNK